MEIKPIDGTFAREVTGVQLWNGLAADQLEQVRDAWTEAGILVFRRQSLSENDRLTKACTQPHQVYKHRWQVGDVILWDNACTMHRRDEYESVQRRFMKRTTIALPAARHIIPRGQKLEAAAVQA